MTAGTTPLAEGRVLGGRYRLGARIGSGGMATILRAWDTSLEREVAVKIIHAHLADNPQVLALFKTEARHAARLNHPHIVGVYDQGVADLPYIVMELVDGPSLREILARRGRLTPQEALAVVEPIARALARAHEAGVVHRDLKPENVLVTPDGVPKVADFGIARAIAETTHTNSGSLVGSVHYMAPELVDGARATPASDQYALGVVLYELLTGRKPLPADTPMAVALRHANEDVPPPSRLYADVSRALDRVVRRATARRPADRYPDCAALAAALAEAVPQGSDAITFVDDDGREHTLVMPLENQPDGGWDAERELIARREQVAARRQQVAVKAPPGATARNVRRVLLTVLATLLLLGSFAFAGFVLWDRVIAPVELIPDLLGSTRDDAFEVLSDRGLDMVVSGSEYSITVERGGILRQDPEGGMRARRGGSVAVILSAGPRAVAMPDVLGQAEDDALVAFQPHQFTVTPSQDYSDTVPAGQVAGQLPEPGTTVNEGSQVLITISLGIEQVEVPDLEGLTQQEAGRALAAARLAPEFTEEWSDDVPEPGMVVSQSLSAGTTVDHDSTVQVVISRGPLTILVPELRGVPLDEALAHLEELELVADVIEEPRPVVFGIPYGPAPGFVEQQRPAPGETIERGETVLLYTIAE